MPEVEPLVGRTWGVADEFSSKCAHYWNPQYIALRCRVALCGVRTFCNPVTKPAESGVPRCRRCEKLIQKVGA